MRGRRQVLVFAAVAAGMCGGPLGVPAAAGARAAGVEAGVARAAGSWGRAIEVPGLGALNRDRTAWVAGVSCPAAGGCAAVGYYADGQDHRHGFVAVERRGRWGRAAE